MNHLNLIYLLVKSLLTVSIILMVVFILIGVIFGQPVYDSTTFLPILNMGAYGSFVFLPLLIIFLTLRDYKKITSGEKIFSFLKQFGKGLLVTVIYVVSSIVYITLTCEELGCLAGLVSFVVFLPEGIISSLFFSIGLKIYTEDLHNLNR